MFPFKLACAAAVRMRTPGILFRDCAVQALPLTLIVRCWSRARTQERIHLQPPPANEFPAPNPMPVNLSRPVRFRAKELTDNAALGSDENPASFCMFLSARVALIHPYNVERIPVQRAWETLSAEHLQALGIDPGKCNSSSTLTAARIFMPSNRVPIPVRR